MEVVDLSSNDATDCFRGNKRRRLECGAVTVATNPTSRDDVVQRAVSHDKCRPSSPMCYIRELSLIPCPLIIFSDIKRALLVRFESVCNCWPTMQLEMFPEVALSHLHLLINKYSVYLDNGECLHR